MIKINKLYCVSERILSAGKHQGLLSKAWKGHLLFLGWRQSSRTQDLQFCGNWNRGLETAYILYVCDIQKTSSWKDRRMELVLRVLGHLRYSGPTESQSGPQYKLKQVAAPADCWATMQNGMTEGWATWHKLSPAPKIPLSKDWEDGSGEDAHWGFPLLKHEKNSLKGPSTPLMTPLEHSSNVGGLQEGPDLAVLLRIQLLLHHFLWLFISAQDLASGSQLLSSSWVKGTGKHNASLCMCHVSSYACV